MSNERQQPNKVLSSRTVSSESLDAWAYEDFPGDPYWQGGSTPKPYRWRLSVNVTQQPHGDPSTRRSFLYTGSDVFVGDWISDVSTGKALRITNILSKTDNNVDIVVEDVDRYNTFLDEAGNGIFPIPSNCIIFTINDMHLPILNPLPSSIANATFTQEVIGRFNNNNPLYRRRMVQASHGLQDNEAIWVDPVDGLFKGVRNDDELKRMVGTVDRTGPGQDVFYFIPTTKVVDEIDPPLPGTAGDLIYSDPFDGSLSTDPTERVKLSYIQLTNSTPDTTSSTDNTVTQGAVLEINGIDVTFTGTSMSSVVDNVNSTTSLHNVGAVLESGVNEMSTDTGQLSYGIVACIGTSTVASINGVSVSFDDTTNGSIEFGFNAANAVDMANSINATNIPNIEAVGLGSSRLTIRNTQGGSITIANITNDDSSVPFAGNSSCSGVPTFKEAGGDETILFTNELGSGIIFQNVTGFPVAELGLTSVRNGMLPMGLVVEQYITESASGGDGATVYATLDELPPFGKIGTQAFVIDSEDENGNKSNEWTMFLWDGFGWVKTSDEDSAGTDARSIEAMVSFDSASPIEIGTLSDGKRVAQVVVEVITEFDGVPTLNIGDEDDPLRLMQDDMIDLSTISSYSATSNFIYQTGNDVTVIAEYSSGGATRGQAKVIVTYI